MVRQKRGYTYIHARAHTGEGTCMQAWVVGIMHASVVASEHRVGFMGVGEGRDERIYAAVEWEGGGMRKSMWWWDQGRG